MVNIKLDIVNDRTYQSITILLYLEWRKVSKNDKSKHYVKLYKRFTIWEIHPLQGKSMENHHHKEIRQELQFNNVWY
jgi:hypothetical protein